MAATYITLAQAKKHLRVDFDADDTIINDLSELAEEYVITDIQGQAHHKIEGTISITTNKNITGVGTNFTDFKSGDVIKPVGVYSRIIDAITDDETATVTVDWAQTLTEVEYNVYTGIPGLMADGELPLRIKQAMLLMLGHFYMLREPYIIGTSIKEVPKGYNDLIAPYKNYTIG